MAAVVIVGPDSATHRDLRRALLRAGFHVLDASGRQAALRVLGSTTEHLVAILIFTPPDGEVAELLGAVAVDDRLRTGNRYVLMDADPENLPPSIAHLCDDLGVPVVAQPLSAQDTDDWDDVLDAVYLALRHFPDADDGSALDSSSLPSGSAASAVPPIDA
jgi:hypothetical protein